MLISIQSQYCAILFLHYLYFIISIIYSYILYFYLCSCSRFGNGLIDLLPLLRIGFATAWSLGCLGKSTLFPGQCISVP